MKDKKEKLMLHIIKLMEKHKIENFYVKIDALPGYGEVIKTKKNLFLNDILKDINNT